jgi:hypothetical protein
MVNDLLCQLNMASTPTTNSDMPSSTTITDGQQKTLLQCFHKQQATIEQLMAQHQDSSSTSTNNVVTPPKYPGYYSNARYEDIICKPIKPAYDGNADQLVPFLNRLDIRRQDESWYPITFVHIKQQALDLL